MLIIWTYVPISSKIIQRSVRYVSSVAINMIPDGSEIIIYQQATKHKVVYVVFVMKLLYKII